ncbi:MAG TPA: ferritin-like protein [Pyrinomonadaceae bacterium]|nr:ferritin-like protein [Pyrinomonadaceae bacterium]
MQTAPFFTAEAEVTPENLGAAIQQAIEIEIATIPVYLYTYYSLNRVPNQNAISGALVQQLTAKGMPPADANKVALDLSAQIMVYANKAGATIMSVVMEEMLHMALSSNLKQALIGEPPTLAGRSPAKYPAVLPGHEPEFPINLAPFSLDQLMTFLKIESPQPLTKGALAAAPIPYKTIGQFYDMIKRCITDNDLPYYPQLPQLVPGRHYYATNNIDTVYYDKEHKARYMDADDSGDLVYVSDRASACQAIDQIVEQGEGNKDATPLNPDGSVNCSKPTDQDYDDKSDRELSHFEKFAEIYCEYNELAAQFKSYGLDTDISTYFVLNVPTNPTAANYPAVANQSPTGASYPNGTIQAVAQLISGVSSYLFVMTEACYKSEGNKQYEIFMFGIHKSMIFILNSLCGDINKLTYNMDGQTYIASATFENYPFGLMGSPKAQLLQLYANAVAVYPAISYLAQRFQDLPDVPLN